MNGHHPDFDIRCSVKVLHNGDLPCHILSQLNEYRLQKQFTDAILTVDQEELHCHRCVLSASSPYFQAIFSSQFKEAINANVSLQNISPWIMKRILDYVYSGTVEITLDTALDYLKTGHILHYPAIVDACCELLLQHLHPSNCLGIKEFAALYHCSNLESGAYVYSLENFAAVVEKSEELMQLPLESLLHYLSSDNVDIASEYAMWKAVRSWIYFDVDNRKRHMFDLLSCLRIQFLSSNDLKVILSDPVVRNQPKCLQLLEKVNTPADKIKSLSPALNDHCDGAIVSPEHAKLPGYKRAARPSTLPRDVIVMFGGSSMYELTEMRAYDPIKERWISLPSPPENIVKASITSNEDTIFITGGIVNNELSRDLWRFCCKQRKWSRGEPLTMARAKHSSAALNGFLYLCGGVHLNDSRDIVPMTEIHSYDIARGVWRHVGSSKAGKTESSLLGFGDTLYELGGLMEGTYNDAMETYKVDDRGQVTSTGGHYVLPCIGEPGPLKAALSEEQSIIVLWQKSGDMFSLNTNNRRFYHIADSLVGAASCLVTLNGSAYVLGGHEDDKPCRQGKVLDLSASPDISLTSITLPEELFVQKCVHVEL